MEFQLTIDMLKVRPSDKEWMMLHMNHVSCHGSLFKQKCISKLFSSNAK